MRGILFAWMRQSRKVESFKENQIPKHALHSKFNLNTGSSDRGRPVRRAPSDRRGRSVPALPGAEMINSGLQIISTMDDGRGDVRAESGLLCGTDHIERSYRERPTSAWWERGSKHNTGVPEIHASSIGMAKSALEAINGCNLFGDKSTTVGV